MADVWSLVSGGVGMVGESRQDRGGLHLSNFTDEKSWKPADPDWWIQSRNGVTSISAWILLIKVTVLQRELQKKGKMITLGKYFWHVSLLSVDTTHNYS